MNKKELQQLAAQGEDSHLQFKADIRNADSLAAEMVAFSNSDGGSLLVGVDNHGKINGLSPDDVERVNQLISNAASQHIPACDDLAGSHCPAVEEVPVKVIGEAEAEFSVLAQSGICPARTVVGVRIHFVCRDPLEYSFRVPAEEMELAAIFTAPGRIPVVVGPVVVGAIDVHDHVVDEIRHIEMLLNGLVGCVAG